MIYCDIPVIYEQKPCGIESAIGCFDPNINRISVKIDYPDFMKEMIQAHECGHYYSQGISKEDVEQLEGQGDEHLNREKLATSFYAIQKTPQIVSLKEKEYWGNNNLFRQYLINLIKQLMS
jgi:hypothetical protein